MTWASDSGRAGSQVMEVKNVKCGMVSKYVLRSEFESYEDFVKNFKIDVPANFNFAYDIVDEYAKNSPEKVAMVWCDDKGREEIFTFADVKKQSDKAANYLHNLGIRKGDAVMLMLKRHYEFWFSLIALHKIGAIAVPASHLLTERDITFRNNAADIKLIIAANDERLLDAIDQSQPQSPTLEYKAVVRGTRDGWLDFNSGVLESSEDFSRPTGAEATQNDDTLVIFFTSGTTGMPKMVQHDYIYPLGHILTARYWQNVEDGGLHFTVADTGWAKTAWGKIYGQWIGGSAIFVFDYENKFDAHKILGLIQRHRITTFCGPATVYRMLVKQDLTQYDLSSLRYCVVAGEPLYPEVFHKVHEGMNMKIMEGFGQSETAVAIANFPWMEPKPGSMGKPSPTYNVDLVDENGKPVPVGEQGHIVFRMNNGRPAGMFRKYYRGEEMTKAAWHDGLYYTGDIARRDEDGYYWYVGRADDAIKSSGYKIGPFEVESVLHEHPAVHECAVTGVPDEIRGMIVKATVVLSPGYEAGDELAVELQNHVKKLTAPYKYPRLIEFVDALPKTTSGKIQRFQIKMQDAQKMNGFGQKN